MKKVLFIVSMVSILGSVSSAVAMPDISIFTKLNARKGIILRDCGIRKGINRLKINRAGDKVILPSERDRKPFALGKKFTYFACENLRGPGMILHAKRRRAGGGVSIELKLSDFKKRKRITASGFGCKKLLPWPGGLIYKTIGSSHFTDVRRNTIGVIAKPGSGIYAGECMSMHAANGAPLANLGLYARGAGWDWRSYAGIGCGTSTPVNGSALAARAKAAGGSTQVALKIGETCYGPIEANQCLGSSSC